MRDENGRFVKGSISWNKGKTGVYSEEAIRKMSKAKLGKHMASLHEFKKGHRTWNTGMKGLYISGSEKGWFKKGHKFSKEINERRLENLRKKILLKPNLEMTENLAYLIGLLKGDGYVCCNGRTYRICLDNTNFTIANNCKKSLKEIGLNPFIYEIVPSNGIGKQKQYRVLASSKEFYKWYKKLTCKKLRKLLTTNKKIFGFLRGFYEAEGSISKSRNSITISIYNTDMRLISLIKFLLEKINLNFHLNGPYKNNRLGGYNSKLLYRVQTTNKNEVINFLNLVKPSAKQLAPI